ncbi:hypothetical protein AB5J72_02160 [Streptomyces sp. CG1]|uniref:hypothetical protein n=1 Tax=Streptomyces sp. CG1 TaxID=1287523 RepID=UPI0034E19B5A
MPARTSTRVSHAEAHGLGVRLELAGPGRAETTLTADHVLAAGGYRLDLDAVPFLSPAVRGALACVRGSKAPQMSASLESSVPGLYFTGSLAAPMFGPMMRFVAGTQFAARRITRHASRLSVPR